MRDANEASHHDAVRLPEIERRDGVSRAAAEIGQLLTRYETVTDDYNRRFGPRRPWPEFDLQSPEGKAHSAMRLAMISVCGACPTLTRDAANACERAREPLKDAARAIQR